ncbi:16S rRNA (uracil(1498)-N(3))-methyltransferase [Waterburya agarophytonicola K14]|uniref:Ribosomal RNA small subunit methyltransferase E n=1 Tax=Waterburya agarophytonicola KI4 TaxID=2874699 RepID=A0A964BNH1_9CYAN|nr:16S rRNA (uracil(1498)-N(3))-methyltransferase [Waterburya agarophytonicola]MCC0176334.1 16S rRNA (uracil(1498)-N(3))-methyltransferase [Waterburya agarophytonicola KI4]
MVYRLVVKSEQIEGDLISLDPQQLHYLLRVLRLENGDRFIALDGVGNSWMAEIADQSANIIESIDIKTELPVFLSLITALPKGSGYEQIVRCCTELGVSNFIPAISDRTILKPSNNKVQRWRKIAIEAAEQSERQIVPTILDPLKFTAALDRIQPNQDRYICIARGDIPSLWNCLQNSKATSIVIATGCEGGWTDLEVEKAIALGLEPVSLGNRILRAVTAPIVVSSLVSAICASN